jgi:hypothetical protein
MRVKEYVGSEEVEEEGGGRGAVYMGGSESGDGSGRVFPHFRVPRSELWVEVLEE